MHSPRHVENPFSHDKSNPKEQVTGRNEGKHQKQQSHQHLPTVSPLWKKRERWAQSQQTNQTKKFQVKKLQTPCVKSLFIWQKNYVHYSITHQIHLRTDYLFINTEDRHRIKGWKKGRADVSDHNPLFLSEEVEEKNISVRLSYYEMGPKVNKRLPRQTQYT